MKQPAFLYADAVPTTVTATDTKTGTDPLNVTQAIEGPHWSPLNNTGVKELVLKHSAALPVDFVALLGVALDGVQVEVRGSTDDFATVDDQLSPATALSASLNSAWVGFTGGAYSEIKLVFTSFSSALEIDHVAVGTLKTIPYFKRGHDSDNSTPTGNHMVSTSGVYNGVTQQNLMRDFKIDIHPATVAKMVNLRAFKAACIDRIAPFFFVPDTDLTLVHFCWMKKPKFSAPEMAGVGLFKVAPMILTTRGS